MENEPKTAASRRQIVLPAFAMDALVKQKEYQMMLREQAGKQWDDLGLVFSNMHGGYIIPANLHSKFKSLLVEAGLPDISFHCLRHTTATVLFSLGVPVKVIQELLGHTSISITMDIYASVLPAMHEQAMVRLNEAFKLLP